MEKKCKDEPIEDGNGKVENGQIENVVNQQMENEPVKEKEVANPQERESCKCSECPYKTDGKVKMAKHAKIHQRNDPSKFPIKCGFCRAAFAKEQDKTNHERNIHTAEMKQRVQLERGNTMPAAKKTTVRSNANSESSTALSNNGGQSKNNNEPTQTPNSTKTMTNSKSGKTLRFIFGTAQPNETTPIVTNPNGGTNSNDGTNSTHPQTNNQQEKIEKDSDVEIIDEPPNPKKRPGRPRKLIPPAASIERDQNAAGPSASAGPSTSAGPSSSIVGIFNACAQSGVTLHNFHAAQGITIGRITPPFQCGKCKQSGSLRCLRGHALCVKCCAHRGCH